MIERAGFRPDSSGGVPRAYLRPSLLLLLAEAPSHGYELLEQVRAVGVRLAEPSGLYRALRSLDEDRLVSSWWEPSQSGPARRLYAITDAGRAGLEAYMADMRDMRWLLDALLDRYDVPLRSTRRSP